MTKSARLNLGDNICWHYRSIFNHCELWLIWPAKQSNSVKKRKKNYYAVQDHSRSSRSVPIASPYATSY